MRRLSAHVQESCAAVATASLFVRALRTEERRATVSPDAAAAASPDAPPADASTEPSPLVHPPSTSSLSPPTERLPSERLGELVGRTYFEHPIVGLGVHHFATGNFTRRVGPGEYLMEMHNVHLSPIVEVNSRVHVTVGKTEKSAGRIAGGIVGKVNSDGTFGVLLDDNSFVRRMTPERIVLVEGRSLFTLEKDYLTMMEWFRDAGVRRHSDRERICSMLYQRGWREPRLYLLTGPDINSMTYLKKSVRMVVLEKAEWQRMHHAEMRGLLREKVKEREWRYFIQKFSGFVSANWAGLGVISVFLWNFKNWRKMQRAYQMKYAVSTLTHESSHQHAEKSEFVHRTTEENWARQILRQLDITRPRIAVLTGMAGCGKSSLFRTAIRKESKPALFVEVRGQEDALACVLKSMKVPSPDACGDYLDFISDAFTRSTKINGEPPIVVITLREGGELSRAYNETALLACDRNLCHLVFEVALESLTISNISLPRVDFYSVPNFTPRQAFQYTQHAMDPVALRHFIEVIGTNSNDIDELFAAVHHRHVSVMDYTNNKLAKAMRQVQTAWTVSNVDADTITSGHLERAPALSPASGTEEQHADASDDGLFGGFIASYFSSGSTVLHHHNHHNSVNAATSTPSMPAGTENVDARVKAALKKLAEEDFNTGQHSGVDADSLRHAALRDIVLYDPVQDRWLFTHKALHSAARCQM